MAEMAVRRLDLCDLVDVFHAYAADPVVAWFRSALFDACGLFEEVGDGRCLCDEGESAVWLDGDQGGDGHARLYVCCARVELFAKVHGLDAARAEGWADGRAGGRLARADDYALASAC